MITEEIALRFGGIARLYGEATFNRFITTHVTVVGIGGVGSWVAESLARSGIGAITLIDLDDICVSNTNRQIHALNGQYGKLKVEAMAERIRAIHPGCHVRTIEDFISVENVSEYLTQETHYVIDAIDQVKVKAAMIAHCYRTNIPMITMGGAGGRIDPGYVKLIDLAFTKQDPLLARVRSILRREYGFTRDIKKKFKIDCIYSEEPIRHQQPDGSVCPQKPGLIQTESRMDCQTGLGASMVITASFGLFATAQVLKRLTT